MDFIFACRSTSEFLQVGIILFDEVARHVQGSQNRKLVLFLQHVTKKVSQLLLCSIKEVPPLFCCDAKHSDILRGSSHVRCYLLFLILLAKVSWDSIFDYLCHSFTFFWLCENIVVLVWCFMFLFPIITFLYDQPQSNYDKRNDKYYKKVG